MIGDCINVCAACGMRVYVNGVWPSPTLIHEADCPRMDWPLTDAVEYVDGTLATIHNWARS